MIRPAQSQDDSRPASSGERLLAAAREFAARPDHSGLSRTECDELLALIRGVETRLRPARAHEVAALPLQDRTARAYFDYSLSGILETDAAGRIGRANQAAASITRRDAKSLRGQDLATVLPAHQHAALQRHLALLQEQGINHAEWTLDHSDGSRAIIEIASVQIGDDHLLHVFDDVSAQRRAAAEIEAARRAAEAANQAKSDFLANVSHEVRTPLNGILGLARLALATPLAPQQRDYLEKITQSGATLLRILNDLLDFAKIEAGAVEFERIAFDLDALLHELTVVTAQRADDPGLDIAFRVAPTVPRRLIGDRLRVVQCLMNLLGNALKFTRAGSVTLHIDIVAQTPSDVTLALAVADTGIGIAPETLARLFQPFSQADASTTRRFGGTGLGLAIAREFARGMGGDLTVTSTLGAGSRFTLTLPFGLPGDAGRHDTRGLAHASAPLGLAAPTRTPTLLDEVPDEFRGAHLLVAEDNAVNQIVLRELLALAGIGTTLCENGREAVERLTGGEPLPDLILMDVQMPELDGLAATRALRSAGVKVPVIGVSAGTSRTETAACLDAGMNDVLPKPIDADELWGALTRWIPPRNDTHTQAAPESAEARFRGHLEVLASARELFTQGHADDARKFRDLLTAVDRPAIVRLAHALRGSAATIGADRVAAVAETLETLAPGVDVPELAQRIDTLEAALAEFTALHPACKCPPAAED